MMRGVGLSGGSKAGSKAGEDGKSEGGDGDGEDGDVPDDVVAVMETEVKLKTQEYEQVGTCTYMYVLALINQHKLLLK